jgi:hypothetical protein
MPFAKVYTFSEVNRILQESEGRPSPTNQEPGHALALHVNARGLQLSDRLQPGGRAITGGLSEDRIAELDAADGRSPSKVRVPLPRPIGNPGHQSITTPGRSFVMGWLKTPGPANRQDVLNTWANFELEQAKIARVAHIAQLSASNKKKSVLKGAQLANEPPLTAISRNKEGELKLNYALDFEGKEFSGAFADRQQAVQIARDLLNCPEGQSALARMDRDILCKRVEIKVSVPNVLNDVAVKIHLSSRDTIGGETPVLTDISEAYMLVDRLSTGDIHIQTFYPIA